MHGRFFIGITAALLAGCGSAAQLPAHRSGAGAPATSSSYKVLHRFGDILKQRGGTDPGTGLLAMNGTLYGTTSNGGKYGDGTVFSITPARAKKTLYNFGATAGDGVGPSSELVALNGTLYGLTFNGGSCGAGTVYGITASGSEQVVHSLCHQEGANPQGGLIALNGTLYGTTTAGGGSSGNQGGTVFSLTTSGGFTVLHSFNGLKNDGFSPTGHLAVIKGTIYGTTLYGGGQCYYSGGCGSVYGITTSGKERVVYGFTGTSVGNDGWLPEGGVIAAGGILYGTTFTGGEGPCFLNTGCGIVYSVTTNGVEQVLYRFESASTGENPGAGVIDVNGTLYGTTAWGGGGSCSFDTTRFTGCGTVFGLTTSGGETVLHAFVGGSDGANPGANLTLMNGTLYGTTTAGGFKNKCRGAGCGTVFAVAP